MSIIQTTISEMQLNEFREAFAIFDRDGDGFITNKELGSVLRTLGQNPTQREIQDMIDEVDLDSNGCIDFNEFIILMTKQLENSDREKELEEAFKVFDRDGDGFISAVELKYTLTTIGERLTDEEVNNMLREADMNDDGLIDINEFKRMMI